MTKHDQIRKWLQENQGKNIWIKQYAYNVAIDITMEEGYSLTDAMGDDDFTLTDRDSDTVIEILVSGTKEDNIKVGFDRDTFGATAIDFEADFEIELEHCLLLFILQ